jgi:hypothetical protein
MDTIISILNTDAAITTILGIFAWLIARVFAAKPEWKAITEKYGPYLISAVKAAEKAIPNDVENKSLARLDFAAQAFLTAFPDSGISTESVKAAITDIHAKLEAGGNL